MISTKQLKLFALAIFALPAALTFTACGDDDPTDPDPNPDPNPENPTPGGEQGGPSTTLTEAQQKQQLQNTANDLMGKVSAEDFRRITKLAEYVDNNTQGTDEVDNWFDSCIDACDASTSSTLAYLYKASNFYGVFELQNGNWRLVTPDVRYLEFQFENNAGTACALRLTCSEAGTAVHHEVLDDVDWGYYHSNGHYYEVETRTKNTYVIPDRISLTLTEGSSTLVTAEVNSNITLNGGDSEFDYNRDRLDVTTTAQISQYNVTVSRAQYNAGREASVEATLSKGGETLISLKGEADGNLSDEDNLQGSITTLSFDILGQVRIGGNITDIHRFNDYLDEADRNRNNETALRENINAANQLMNIGIYFNGSSTASSWLKLYPMVEDNYWSGEEWCYETVIAFADGSSYSMLENYFSEDYFRDVIESFEDLANDFIHLIDEGESVEF